MAVAGHEKAARSLVAAEQREAIRRAAREEHRLASRAASEHAELVPASVAASFKSSSLRPPKLPEIDADIEHALDQLNPLSRDSSREEITAAAPSVAQFTAREQASLASGFSDQGPITSARRVRDPRVDPDDTPTGHDTETAEAPSVTQLVATPAAKSEVDGSHQESPPPLMRNATPTPGSVRPQGRAPSRHPPQTDRSDEELVHALEQGHLEEGLELLERLQADRTRARDAVVVAQHLAALDPGDASLLGRLVTTASRDGNEALALAVRHVLGAYGSGDPVTPPRLDRLDDQGPAARALLEQSTTPAHEALALVWEHAGGLHKKDLGFYGVTGLERVPLNTPTPLGELYSGAARILGMTRTAVFRQAGQDDISMQVALLTPPAVIVAGEVHYQSTQLAFHFGAMLAAAAPEHALLFGCKAPAMTSLLDALALSFGTGNAGGARPAAEVTRIASYFWETIPARVQRRLTQICSDPSLLSWQQMMAASRQALRRAGLIVCGDLPTAIGDACFEAGLTAPTTLGGLAECASSSAAVADLLGLALSPEYAELRFRVSR